MLDFTMTFEDGDYEVFKSTNHADPDRIAMITVSHDLHPADADLPYQAMVVDSAEEEINEEDTWFFETFDEAQRYIETKVSAIYIPGQMRVISSTG